MSNPLRICRSNETNCKYEWGDLQVPEKEPLEVDSWKVSAGAAQAQAFGNAESG